MDEIYTIAWATPGTSDPDVLIPPVDESDCDDPGMLVYRSREAATKPWLCH